MLSMTSELKYAYKLYAYQKRRVYCIFGKFAFHQGFEGTINCQV